jgi:DNA-binding MarR family transcriptional regulator
MGSHGIDEPADEAAESVLVAIRKIVRMLRLAEQRPDGVSAAQLFVLRVLVDAPAASLADLARRTLTDQSSVSTVVAKLVEKKLVAKRVSRTDRRRAELALTPAGAKIAAATETLPQQRIVDAVRAMPAKQRAALVGALDGLVAAVGASDLAPHMFLDEPARPPRG